MHTTRFLVFFLAVSFCWTLHRVHLEGEVTADELDRIRGCSVGYEVPELSTDMRDAEI